MRPLRALMLLGLAACGSEVDVEPAAGGGVEVPGGSATGSGGSATASSSVSSNASTTGTGGEPTPRCPSGSVIWARSFGGPAEEVGADVAVAPDGRIAVAGSFDAVTDLGFGCVPSNGSSDAFLLVVSTAGDPLWARTAGGGSLDHGASVAFNDDGSVLIAGDTFGAIDLGGGVLPDDATFSFLARYDSTGAHAWSTTYGQDAGPSSERIAPNAGAGAFFTAAALPLPSGNSVVVAQLDETGVVTSEVLAAGPWAHVRDLEHDAAAGAVVVGTFWKEFDVGVGLHVGLGEEQEEAFIVRVAPDATPVWSKAYGGPDQEAAEHVVLDPTGNLLVVTLMNDLVVVDGVSVPAGMSILKLSPSGEAVSVTPLDLQAVEDIAVNSQGEIGILGILRASLMGCDFGRAVVRLSADGQLTGVLTHDAELYGIAAHPADGSWIVTGLAHQQFGGVPLSGAGGGDVLVARIAF